MLYETIIPATGHSFTKRNFIFKYFPTQWHYHKEFELTLITNGWGKRFVGDGVDDFKVGDIVLFGENLPHFHMCDKTYYENNDLYCSSEVIQFTRDIFQWKRIHLLFYYHIGLWLFMGSSFTYRKTANDSTNYDNSISQ